MIIVTGVMFAMCFAEPNSAGRTAIDRACIVLTLRCRVVVVLGCS